MQPNLGVQIMPVSPQDATPASGSVSPVDIAIVPANDQGNWMAGMVPGPASRGPGNEPQVTAAGTGTGLLPTGGPLLGFGMPIPGGMNIQPAFATGAPTWAEQHLQALQNQMVFIQNMLRSGGAVGQGHPQPMDPLILPPPRYAPEIDANGWYVNKPRDRAEFPNVLYWRQCEWRPNAKESTSPGEEKGQKGPTRMANNENVCLGFITDAEGNVIDGTRAGTIRRRFREFCVYLHRNKRAPRTWQQGIDSQIALEYHHWMRTQCFELQLCEDDWKADRVAIKANYSQWKTKYEARLARMAAKAKELKKLAKLGKKAKAIKKTKGDREFEEDVAGSENVGKVLADAPFRMSPSPEAAAAGSSGHRESAEPDAEAPPSKRQRTASPTPPSSPSRPGTPASPDTSSDSLPPAMPEPPQENVPPPKVKITFKKPLAALKWSTVAPAPTSASRAPTSSPAIVPTPSASPAAPSSPAPSSPPVADASSLPSTTPATAATAAPSSSGAATQPTPVAPPTAAQSLKMSKPKPRKVGASDAFPPPDDDAHRKPKDICARIWARKNPEGTRAGYDEWYKGKKPYRRQLYAATDGARGDTPEPC